MQIGLSVWCSSADAEADVPCLLAFNPASERIAGTPLAPFLGKPFRAIAPFAAGGEVEALLARVASERRSLDFSVERSRDPSHPARALSIKAFPVGERCVGLAVEDVTVQTGIALERNHLEQQLRDLSAHVEAALEDERTGIAREIHDELGQSLSELRRLSPSPRVLVLTMYSEEQYAVRAIRAGAAGFLTKESAPDELIAAVRKIASGGRYVSGELAEALASLVAGEGKGAPHERVTDREFEIFKMLAAGRTVSQVAQELALSVKTVSTHRTRILKKMEMKTNAELTQYAVRNGLVE